MRQALALGVLALALGSIAARLIRLEVVYGWSDAAYMPPHAALGVALLGAGAWLTARREMQRAQGSPEGRGILLTVAASLAATTVVAGVMGFAFLQQRVEETTTETLARLQGDRSRLFTSTILQHSLQAAASASSPATIAQMRALARTPNDADARGGLRDIANAALQTGFSWIAFEQGGERILEAGSPVPRAELEFALRGPFRRELVWNEGFYLRLRIAVRDGQHTLGEVVAERPLDILTLLAADANQWGESGEMMLCDLRGDPFRCVPGRFFNKPFSVARAMDGRASVVALALAEKPGVASTRDFRGERVLAAYGQVGNYGLGMVVKMDWVELYAPMRRQLQFMVASLGVIVALSLWLVHARVRPLLRQLVESRQRAQANEARFLAAAENSPDAFFILESVRDNHGAVADFRVAYMNGNAARLFSSGPKERLIGQSLCALLPVMRSGGFVDKYQQVVSSGHALVEEFPVDLAEMKASWLSQQVVRLGDGVAVTTRDISERKALEEKFKYMAQNDALTGLPNRALFLDRLEHALARARRSGAALGLMFLDIDRFKSINDTQGHAAGDELLRAFADRLRESVRPSDTVARLGGDEFTVILEDLATPADAEVVARNIAAALLRPIRAGTDDIIVTSSIGISFHRFAPDNDMSPGMLLEHADQALYEVKRRGRNGYALHRPELVLAGTS